MIKQNKTKHERNFLKLYGLSPILKQLENVVAESHVTESLKDGVVSPALQHKTGAPNEQ